MKIVYVDGKFVPREQAVIPVDDLAVLRGYAAWDIMRIYRGRPYFMDEHIERLMVSAKKIGLDLPWSHQEIQSVILTLLEKNPGMDQANIRVLITGGSSPDYFTPSGRSRLIVLPTKILEIPPQWYTKGVKVITIKENRALPDVKITGYIQAALALKKAKAAAAVEAVYINSENQALEATTSNLFAFIKGVLVTPDTGILKGITRKTILSLAEPRFKISKQPLPLSDLLGAGEVFISATNKGVVPVIQIDDVTIGSGTPGPDTRFLMAALNTHASAFTRQK